MQLEQIVAVLITERDRLNRAIEALRDSSAPAEPKAATAPAAAPDAATPKRKRRTAAQRKAHSERMRAFWAARRKQEQKAK